MDNKPDFVNVEMLDKFSAYYRKQLKIYDRMIDAIFEAYWKIAKRRETEQFLEVAELEIDKYVNMLFIDVQDSLNEEECAIMHTFLYALRKDSGQKRLLYNGVEMLSAHEFVAEFMHSAAITWIDLREECRNTSISATQRFFAEFVWEQDFSSSIALYALLAAEYAKAREILLAQPEAPL